MFDSVTTPATHLNVAQGSSGSDHSAPFSYVCPLCMHPARRKKKSSMMPDEWKISKPIKHFIDAIKIVSYGCGAHLCISRSSLFSSPAYNSHQRRGNSRFHIPRNHSANKNGTTTTKNIHKNYYREFIYEHKWKHISQDGENAQNYGLQWK